jgi:hypothetical protein
LELPRCHLLSSLSQFCSWLQQFCWSDKCPQSGWSPCFFNNNGMFSKWQLPLFFKNIHDCNISEFQQTSDLFTSTLIILFNNSITKSTQLRFQPTLLPRFRIHSPFTQCLIPEAVSGMRSPFSMYDSGYVSRSHSAPVLKTERVTFEWPRTFWWKQNRWRSTNQWFLEKPLLDCSLRAGRK